MPIGYTFMYEDALTILLAVIGFIVAIWAQIKVSSAYSKYKKIKCREDINGAEVARIILEEEGLSNIYVVETHGELTDHYDPGRKVVKLTTDIFHGNTIAAVSIAAHECAHAVQDKEGYTFMKIRAMLVPIVNFVSYAGYLVLLLSVLASVFDYLLIGVLLILISLVFQLITLPVEFDASRKALVYLKDKKLLETSELVESKHMLDAAAMTYVASVITSVLSLIRILIMINKKRD